MSSLSATQADGYYLPPEYYDSGTYKKKSKNQFAGSKGHNQYEQKGVVRFELPYKGICGGCGISIGRGTRYNAKKAKTDESYFTTPIWEFTMTCRAVGCGQTFRIRTNPKERGFDFVHGVSIQQGQEVELEKGLVQSLVEQKATNSLERLESEAFGKRKTMTELDQLKTLQKLSVVTSLEDSNSNSKVRERFRKERKAKRRRLEQAAVKGWRDGMELSEPSASDASHARKIVFGKSIKEQEQERFANVRKSSIFAVSSKKQHKRKRKSRRESPSILPSPITSSSSSTYRNEPDPLPARVASSSSAIQSPLECASSPAVKHEVDQISQDRKNENISTNSKKSSLEAMLSGYGSDSDEE